MSLPGILKVGGIATVIYLLTRRKLVSDLQITLKRVTFAGDLLQPVINITFDIFNPTQFSSTVRNIAGSLYLNTGQRIADVVGNNPTIIQPGTHSDLTISMAAIYTGVSDTILQLIRAANTTSFTFKGSMNIDNVPGIPINITY